MQFPQGESTFVGGLLPPTCLTSPLLDLRAKPESRPAGAKVEHRPWHIWVTPLIEAHGVPLGQPQQFGDTHGVDQVFRTDLGRHAHEPTRVDSEAIDD